MADRFLLECLNNPGGSMYAVVTAFGVYGVFRDVNVAESAAESLGNLGISAEVKLMES